MTPEPIPVYEGQDFYVPYFQVKLEGRPPGQDVVRDIITVTYKDDIKQVDSFEITINNWDAGKRTFKYSDQKLFDPGKKLELWMGYYGRDRLRLMINGKITSLRPTFPSGGQPTLAISGLNALHSLRTKQEPQAYEKLGDSQIAQQIASRLGVTLRTEQTAAANEETFDYLFQENEYPIVYLMKRAVQIGYDLFVEEIGENGQASESRIYFGPSVNVRQVVYKLTYGRSLIEFQPNLTVANQVGAVTVQSWDQKRKKKIEYTARRSDITTQGVGARGGQADINESFREREEVVTDQPVESEAEARRLATERHERIAKDMIKGSGSTVGLPDLRAGSVVHIDGLGKRFSGRYFVTSTTHSIGDSGYTTKFECRREEV
jgi:phage protein D